MTEFKKGDRVQLLPLEGHYAWDYAYRQPGAVATWTPNLAETDVYWIDIDAPGHQTYFTSYPKEFVKPYGLTCKEDIDELYR
jgi:hypothetical protein